MTKCILNYVIAFTFLSLVASSASSQEVLRDQNKMVTGIKYAPIDKSFLNPITPAEEMAWWDRVRTVLRTGIMNSNGTFKPVDSRTFGESEKWSYPDALKHILAGDVQASMKVLESEDDAAKGWNAYTEGIDLWFGFTVQGQVAKYFFTGSMMTLEYKQRMERAFKIWTLTNPQHTPHPMYMKYNPALKDGWGPDRFGNRRVDPRRTDAMWGFTTTAVYLFAEASGNEATRLEAKDELLRYAWSLYHIGMGEWDSSTYMPFSIAPYLNLHAYAKDSEVRMAAKLVLDYYHTAAALTYRRGLFSGASKRDYGNAYHMYAGAGNGYFPLIFGDAKGVERAQEGYGAYPMISPYRPALAMLALARRQLAKPVEVLACKPPYETWKMSGDTGPAFFETQFLARTYDLSSVVGAGGDSDVGPFRLVFDTGNGEAETFLATSGPRFPEKYLGDSIGQYRNLLLWLSPADGKDQFQFALPSRISFVDDDGWKFADAGKTWIALQPFGVEPIQHEGNISSDEKEKRERDFGATSFYIAKRRDSSPGGFAMIVAEQGDYPSFDAFRKAIVTRAKLNVTKLGEKAVRLTGTEGTFIEVTQNDASLPGINRNGELRDWSDRKNWKLWQTVDSDLLSLGWKEGKLNLSCGGRTFFGTATLEGWEQPDATPAQLEQTKNLKMTSSFSNN